MTCIVGMIDKENDCAWIGGDSLGSNGFCSQKINGINRRKINKNNTSGYRNVSFDGRGNPIVQLQDENGKNQVWRGFKDVHEAGKFAEQKRIEIYDKRIRKDQKK